MATLSNEADAVSAASKLTQLLGLSHATSIARKITVADDNTPFLARDLNGRQAWKVEAAGVSLRFVAHNQSAFDQMKRTFYITLDAGSGQLISITSSAAQLAVTVKPGPSAASAESQIRAMDKLYLGLPDVEPQVTFLEALNTVFASGAANPLLAQNISGSYVIDSKKGLPRRVWVISLRGLPPFAPYGRNPGSVPEWQRDHLRVVVDAESNVLLFATTVPQPI